MNAARAQAEGEAADARWWRWVWLAAVVGAVAVTRQSLWIDEALTAAKATASGIFGWWQAMLADKASDLQMPLYMLYIWGFAKIFGTGEWTLRIANLPWFAAGAAAFISTFAARKKMALAFITLVSPFAWYYLDEARPYAMQLGASLLIFAALVRLSGERPSAAHEQRWAAVFFFGVLMLCGSSLLGMVWIAAVGLSLPTLFSWRRLGELLRAHELVWATLATAMAAMAAYYFWTMRFGARASDLGRTDFRNVLFIAYELLGFSGLGPGRLEIRDGGFSAFKPFLAPLLLYGIALGGVAFMGGRELWRKSSRIKLVGIALAISVPLVVILAAGVALHFRVLGRHCTPLLVIVWMILWPGLEACRAHRARNFKALAALFVMLSIASCLSFRFAARHAKDDYRGAAAAALEQIGAGKTVWWNADGDGATYYQVPLTGSVGARGKALWLMNPDAETLARLPSPDFVITSRPDVYDGRGAFAEFLRRGRYVKLRTLAAFTIWQRPGDLARFSSARRQPNLIE